MFHKEGSFHTSHGKKAKDAPLKKSDRRKLRDRFLHEILGFLPTSDTSDVNDTNDTNDANSNNNYNISPPRAKAVQNLIHDIFMDSKADISVRIIKQKDAKSNAGATKVYIRTPSNANTSSSYIPIEQEQDQDQSHPDSNDPDSNTDTTPASLDPILDSWPYKLHPQPILIELTNPSTHKMSLLPTLSLLSTFPTDILTSLPTIILPQMVSKYICRGADLMRSGIFNLPSVNSKLNRSGWVCLMVEKNIQPMAIGFISKGTTMDTVGVGTKGVGVHVVSSYGDDIWKAQCRSSLGVVDSGGSGKGGKGKGKGGGGSGSSGDGVVSMIGGGLFDGGDYGNVGFVNGSMVHSLRYEDEENEEESEAGEAGEEDGDEDGEDAAQDAEQKEKAVDVTETENDLKDVPQSVKHEEGDEEEETSSSSVKPSGIDADSEVVSTTEQMKDVTISTGVEPIKAPSSSTATTSSASASTKKSSKRKEANAMSVKKMAVVNLYIIPPQIITALYIDKDAAKASQAKSEDRRDTGFLTAPECRDILNAYLLGNDLIDEYDPEFVTMDASLYDVLYRRNKKDVSAGAKDVPDQLTRKELNTRWMKVMENAYAIVAMPGNKILTMKRGKPPMVQVEVKAREKRKFVTYVRGLEEYAVNASEFANDVSKRFACSSSISDNPLEQNRAALRKGHVEIAFQGNLAKELEALLTGNEKLTSHGGAKGGMYCVPKGVIEFVFGKGVKGGRR